MRKSCGHQDWVVEASVRDNQGGDVHLLNAGDGGDQIPGWDHPSGEGGLQSPFIFKVHHALGIQAALFNPEEIDQDNNLPYGITTAYLNQSKVNYFTEARLDYSLIIPPEEGPPIDLDDFILPFVYFENLGINGEGSTLSITGFPPMP